MSRDLISSRVPLSPLDQDREVNHTVVAVEGWRTNRVKTYDPGLE